MADDTATPPAPTEAEVSFDQSAAWDADSLTHAPAEAGNDASPVPSVAVDVAGEPTSELEPQDEAPAVVAEEPARNDQGQFVKQPKGKGKPRSDPQARVEAATAKEAAAKEEARQAKQELDTLRARLAALEASRIPSPNTRQPPAPLPATSGAAETGVFPGFDDWAAKNPGKDWDVYHRELTRHEAQVTARQIAQQQFQQWQAQQQFSTVALAHQARIDAAKKTHADWDQVLEQGNNAVTSALNARGVTFRTDVFQAALFESERGPDMLRYLAQHPEEAVQLAVEVKDLPVTAAPMLRRVLESRLAPAAVDAPPDSAPKPLISAANPPINRVGGSASATPLDPDDLDFGPEYVRLENERERKRAAMGRW